MNHSDKARFILALHKNSLQAFDSGGLALSQGGQGQTTQNATNPNTSGIAGAVGNVLGTNNNFQASGANVQAGTNVNQLNASYNGVQGALGQQQAFAQQAAAQGGFGNQSNVFAQQQALANQLQMQANGQGPNPAQAALNQETGRNVANQAALMAGQRGSSANAGLIARQAAQQGAGIQQQAVGQGATLQAQQQIAAQSALQNQQAQMQGVAANQIAAQGQGANNFSSAQQNEQNILQNANTSYNNAGVGMQSNINNVNAQTSASNQNANQNVIGGILSGLSTSSIPFVGGHAKGGMVERYAEGGDVEDSGEFHGSPGAASDGPAIPATATNPTMASNPMVMNGGGKGGSGGGAGGLSALALLAAAQGGVVPGMYADGGLTGPALMAPASSGPMSFAGQWLNSSAPASGGPTIGATAANPQFVNQFPAQAKPQKPPKPSDSSTPSAPNMGPSDSMGSGHGVTSLDAKGGKVAAGGPAQKAVKKDNSYSNDKIPSLLSEGEIVLPRSVTTHPKAPEKAAEFVRAVLAKRGKK